MTSHYHLVAASRIEDEPVFSPSGERLGKVADVMLDKATGRAAYVLLGFDGFLGIGERYYPVPWSSLAYDTHKQGYVAPLTPSDLEKAYSVADKEIEDEIQWREAVHAYYGASPYWSGPPLT
jgi:sporulation protein YlmC with PRC-barrel domain